MLLIKTEYQQPTKPERQNRILTLASKVIKIIVYQNKSRHPPGYALSKV